MGDNGLLPLDGILSPAIKDLVAMCYFFQKWNSGWSFEEKLFENENY